MLVVMLRWRGWDIKYFGPNLSLDGFPAAIAPLKPRMLLFSATTDINARELLKIGDFYALFPEPKPIFVFGGLGFRDFEMPASLPGIVINGSPEETVKQIEDLLEGLPEGI